MAELLFLKFDRERSGDVDLSEFLEAFSVMVKGTFQEKADALFEFFADDQPGMSYKGLLKVVCILGVSCSATRSRRSTRCFQTRSFRSTSVPPG